MIQINNKLQKTREQHIKDALIEFEKDLLNFQLSLQTKDNNYRIFQAFKLNKNGVPKNFEMKIDNLKKKIILLEKEENNLKNKKVKIIQKSKYN